MIGKRVVAGRELADIRAGRGRFGMGVAPEKLIKGYGGTWFHNAETGQGNPNRDRSAHQKVPSFRFDGSGRSFQTTSVEASKGAWDNTTPGRLRRDDSLSFGLDPDATLREQAHLVADMERVNGNFELADAIEVRANVPDIAGRSGVKVPGQIQGKEYAMCRTGAAGQNTLGGAIKGIETDRTTLPDGTGGNSWFGTGKRADPRDVRKQADGTFAVGEQGTKIGGDWFSDPNSTCRKHGSKSNARKAASALIARIPPALSEYVAKQFFPLESELR